LLQDFEPLTGTWPKQDFICVFAFESVVADLVEAAEQDKDFVVSFRHRDIETFRARALVYLKMTCG
jgi:hypothetical protein